jgi:hypothetical protein
MVANETASLAGRRCVALAPAGRAQATLDERILEIREQAASCPTRRWSNC